MDVPVLVEVTRGPAVESRHRGQIVVVDPRGALVKQVGDPETLVCMRSLAKPFQALALIATGADKAFGFGPEELALFSGSLSGQDFQVDLVTRALARLGLTPDALQCGIHPPLHRPSAQALSQAGLKPTPLHNTCAGKHTAMLALCVYHKWPLENYLAVDHPVQHLILGAVGRMVGLPRDEIKVAIDGCGAPVFFMPLKNIALGYARLAASQPGSPGGDLLAAILAYPRHIAGDGRLDTDVMTALPEKVFAKSGAEGGYALALKKGGLGVALKIEDGGARALGPTVVEVLQQLGVATPAAQEALAAYAQPPILNHRKEEVGRIRPVFSL
ncbi:MAG: asparaginase [Syntrophales bacterium]|nr:asparaginase [Syntrophales bacterium]MDD5642040.1 asparaginase [Syntrophales bacterium]